MYLQQVLFKAPDWFFYLYKKGVFDKRGLKEQADVLYQKATNIKIPNNEESLLVAEYYFYPETGKFAHMEIVPKQRPKHSGSSPTYRRPVIDLSFPTRFSSYDKRGNSLLIKDAKSCLFGNEGYRMTKKRCIEFFDDDNNFVI